MAKLTAFTRSLDARAAWRAAFIALGLMAGVVALVILGKSGAFRFLENTGPWLEHLHESPWALPIVIAVFSVTSFTFVVPQYALIGACVVAFGPWLGSAYAMTGTIISGWIHFYLGRFGGAQLLQRYGGNTLNRLSRFIGRNDFVASAIVRNLPISAAIVVNMAFGASHAKFWRFTVGLALGSVPKIAIVALLGQSAISAMNGAAGLAIGGVVLVVLTFATVALATRKMAQNEGV